MKHISALFAALCTLGIFYAAGVSALEVEVSLETPLTSTEAMAFDNAQKFSKEIASGNNDDAMGEASVECPEDNHPAFTVDSVRVNGYWLPNSKSATDKRYSGTINYTIKCSHDRSGGGDR